MYTGTSFVITVVQAPHDLDGEQGAHHALNYTRSSLGGVVVSV